MEKREKPRRKNENQPPIVDGDARPDINLHPEDKKPNDPSRPESRDTGKNITTQYRNDTDSSDDFRDAKQE